MCCKSHPTTSSSGHSGRGQVHACLYPHLGLCSPTGASPLFIEVGLTREPQSPGTPSFVLLGPANFARAVTLECSLDSDGRRSNLNGFTKRLFVLAQDKDGSRVPCHWRPIDVAIFEE